MISVPATSRLITEEPLRNIMVLSLLASRCCEAQVSIAERVQHATIRCGCPARAFSGQPDWRCQHKALLVRFFFFRYEGSRTPGSPSRSGHWAGRRPARATPALSDNRALALGLDHQPVWARQARRRCLTAGIPGGHNDFGIMAQRITGPSKQEGKSDAPGPQVPRGSHGPSPPPHPAI